MCEADFGAVLPWPQASSGQFGPEAQPNSKSCGFLGRQAISKSVTSVSHRPIDARAHE